MLTTSPVHLTLTGEDLMGRPLRIDYDGAYHHITNRGIRRQPIFYEPEDRYDLYELIGRAHERFGIVVHSFCLMTNHIHLIVETPRGGLSKALQLIESSYVRRFNKRHGFDGPLFKDRFHSRLIQQDTYLRNAIVYVMANPLDAGMVDQLCDYPWSSYPYFVGHPAAQPEWLSTKALHTNEIFTKEQLDQAIRRRSSKQFDSQAFPEVIGSEAFIDAALSRCAIDAQTAPHVRRARTRPSLEAIDRAVIEVFRIPAQALYEPARGKEPSIAMGRGIAVHLAQDLGGQNLHEIADHYGFASGQSAGVSASRLRKRAKGDDILALRIEQVRQEAIRAAAASAKR